MSPFRSMILQTAKTVTNTSATATTPTTTTLNSAVNTKSQIPKILHQLKSSPATKWAIGGWSFFLAENILLSENRSTLIQYMNGSESNYRLLYGSCSSVAMGSILYGYFYKVKHQPPFFVPVLKAGSAAGGGGKLFAVGMAAFLVQGLGAVMVSQMFPKLQIPVMLSDNDEIMHNSHNVNNKDGDQNSLLESNTSQEVMKKPSRQWVVRCPFDFTSESNEQNDNNILIPTTTETPNSNISSTNTNQSTTPYHPKGLERVTRHPGLWSMGLLGFGNALITPSLPQALWLSMPLIVAIVGGAHQDSRHVRGKVSNLDHSQKPLEYWNQTSHLPFYALFMKMQEENAWETFWNKELKGLNASLALGMVSMWVMRRSRRMWGVWNAGEDIARTGSGRIWRNNARNLMKHQQYQQYHTNIKPFVRNRK